MVTDFRAVSFKEVLAQKCIAFFQFSYQDDSEKDVASWNESGLPGSVNA